MCKGLPEWEGRRIRLFWVRLCPNRSFSPQNVWIYHMGMGSYQASVLMTERPRSYLGKNSDSNEVTCIWSQIHVEPGPIVISLHGKGAEKNRAVLECYLVMAMAIQRLGRSIPVWNEYPTFPVTFPWLGNWKFFHTAENIFSGRETNKDAAKVHTIGSRAHEALDLIWPHAVSPFFNLIPIFFSLLASSLLFPLSLVWCPTELQK